ncbi:MAG: lipocalin family protein [Chromatiaceae bacterium]|nr:lipocalin family protein [Chromatiaceae bacterium]
MSSRNAVKRVCIPLLLLGVATGSTLADPPRTVDFVDLQRYMGRWYEIAALPNFFQRQCVRDTTADYRLRSDETVAVTNRCRKKDGTFDEAKGIARTTDPATNSKLEVSFVSVFGKHLFWGDYWIIGLGADYDYALVGTPSRRWGWILARDPRPSQQRIASWLERFREQGYDPKAFVLTEH